MNRLAAVFVAALLLPRSATADDPYANLPEEELRYFRMALESRESELRDEVFSTWKRIQEAKVTGGGRRAPWRRNIEAQRKLQGLRRDDPPFVPEWEVAEVGRIGRAYRSEVLVSEVLDADTSAVLTHHPWLGERFVLPFLLDGFPTRGMAAGKVQPMFETLRIDPHERVRTTSGERELPVLRPFDLATGETVVVGQASDLGAAAKGE